MKVLFLGERDDGLSVSSQHALALASSGVGVGFADGSSAEVVKPDVVHLVHCPDGGGDMVRAVARHRLGGVPVVRCWTGRDVIWTRYHAPSADAARTLVRLGVRQFCRTPAQVEVLRGLEVPAEVGPIVSPNLTSASEPEPLPATFTVLVHLPVGRRSFHGGALIDALIGRFPAFRFLVLGDEVTDYSSRKNVEVLGRLDDVGRAIRRTTVTVSARLDGSLSRLGLESLSHGRHVLSTCPWPNFLHVRSEAEFAKALTMMRLNPSFNLEGREAVCREYDLRVGVRALTQLLQTCIDENRGVGSLGQRWLGAASTWCISGLLGEKRVPRPDPNTLPSEAEAFRALLEDGLGEPVGAEVGE